MPPPTSSTVVNRDPASSSSVDDVANRSRSLCRDIERSFLRRPDRDEASARRGVGGNKDLIATARRWVESLMKLGVERRGAAEDATRGDRRRAASDALASLLCTLDDVDVENLQRLPSRRRSGGNSNKRVNEKADAASLHMKRRRRLPSNLRSSDVVQGLHEAELRETDREESDCPKLYLSNSDRQRRPTTLHRVDNRSCSMMGISLQAVLNANVPKASESCDDTNHAKDNAISTLTHDAAILRRDLYRHLAELDIAEIKWNTKRSGCSSNICYNSGSNGSIDEIVLTKVKEMTSNLLKRITSHPTSPSMRLSAIIALDSLREFGLSYWGYRSVLEELLGIGGPWSLNFYAEIVSECDVFEKTLFLVRALSQLMEQAVRTSTQSPQLKIPSLLRAIRYVMVRRQKVLSNLHTDDSGSPLMKKERDKFKLLCDNMSIRFDSVSNWVATTTSKKEREQIIAVLQAEGILSLFCHNDPEKEDQFSASSSGHYCAEDSYPYPEGLSLRRTHIRMGPCNVFNHILSDPSVYEHSLSLLDPSFEHSLKKEGNAWSRAGDDLLHTIFSFLGYRSLIRASQCCKSWRNSSKRPSLWCVLYFKKYRRRNICFEEELLGHERDKAKGSDHFGKILSLRSAADRQMLALSEEGYDWEHIFKSKYSTEKRVQARTCHVIGCLYVIGRPSHFKPHLCRHESSVRARSKKLHNLKMLKVKVGDLHRDISTLQNDLHIEPARESKMNIGSPDDVLSLIFSYLNVKEVLKPICKLWREIGKSNQLWQSLYQHQFGPPVFHRSTTMQIHSTCNDWKQHFHSAFNANCDIRGQVNEFGWAVRMCPSAGCNRTLRSKLEYDSHILKHEEMSCIRLIKHYQRSKMTKN